MLSGARNKAPADQAFGKLLFSIEFLSVVLYLRFHQVMRESFPAQSLTKAMLAEKLYDELGFNKREAKELVELFFGEIRDALEQNEPIKLSGFGNFELRDKAQRPGRNPKTGEEIPISARRVVTFKPGQKLKAKVESYVGTES